MIVHGSQSRGRRHGMNQGGHTIPIGIRFEKSQSPALKIRGSIIQLHIECAYCAGSAALTLSKSLAAKPLSSVSMRVLLRRHSKSPQCSYPNASVKAMSFQQRLKGPLGILVEHVAPIYAMGDDKDIAVESVCQHLRRLYGRGSWIHRIEIAPKCCLKNCV